MVLINLRMEMKHERNACAQAWLAERDSPATARKPTEKAVARAHTHTRAAGAARTHIIIKLHIHVHITAAAHTYTRTLIEYYCTLTHTCTHACTKE